MTRSGERFAVHVSGGKDAPAAARRALLARNGRLPDGVRDDVLLLVTELVANAVHHAGVEADRSLELELELSPRHVRVEVADPGSGFSREGLPPEAPDVGGWGLRIVDQVADDWGVRPVESGTCVWFEIRLAA